MEIDTMTISLTEKEARLILEALNKGPMAGFEAYETALLINKKIQEAARRAQSEEEQTE
jgi:hypothetical protein